MFAVLWVEVRFEAVDELTHDKTYYVRVRHTFKSKVALKEKTQILVLHNKCGCPELRPRNDYLVMGCMPETQHEDRPMLELNRQSYFQLWRPSMMSRLKALKADFPCPDKPTKASVRSSPTPGNYTPAS